MPDDLKYVALIESGLMNVNSPVGASGFWQFMDKTGKQYGLTINTEVDERYHLEKLLMRLVSTLKNRMQFLTIGAWWLQVIIWELKV